MFEIKRTETFLELEGIKELQSKNLKHLISKEEADSQGFVTAEYSMDFFKAMHDAAPSIIAKSEDLVVGYALVATKSLRHHHDLLADLFNSIDKINFHGKLLRDVNYVVVGQLCVAKEYRGQGLVQRMYNYYRDCLSAEYDYLVTDVARDNPRSLKAHKATGFQVIDELSYGGVSWDIVLWDWRNKKGS
jgi:ribosomal protein S18 acetylase RimI-like enzyme